MRIEQEFTVSRPLQQVWEFFQDVPEVAKCLPGAELTEDLGDNQYKGKLDAKVGPMTVSFEGKATVVADEESRVGVIEGSGADRRGGSRARVRVEYKLTDVGNGTRVSVDADVQLSGPAAQFGRIGLIKEMAGRLIGEFTNCLESKLAAETSQEAASIKAEHVSGLSLFVSSLVGAIGEFFKKLLGRKHKS